MLDHRVRLASGLNPFRHFRPDHAGQVRVLRKVLLCSPVVRMAVQIEGGTEQYVMCDVASFVAQDGPPCEVELRIERCSTQWSGRKTGRGRLRNAVATPDTVATVDQTPRGDLEPGNALDVASDLGEFAAWQIRVGKRTVGGVSENLCKLTEVGDLKGVAHGSS